MSIRKGEELIAITPDKIDSVNNQNDNTNIKFWTGTKAEYEAIEVKNSNTLYNVVDDTDVTLNLLNVLYPVGSLYLTTTSTCPLATLGIGTWILEATKILVDIDNIAHVVGNGMTLGFTNGTNNLALNTAIVSGASSFRPNSNNYGKENGNINSNYTDVVYDSAIGITTDSTKSGIEANINSTSLPCNVFRRIA